MIEDIKNGKYPLTDIESKQDKVLVADYNNNAIAIYRKDHNKYRFVRGLF